MTKLLEASELLDNQPLFSHYTLGFMYLNVLNASSIFFNIGQPNPIFAFNFLFFIIQ